MFGQRKHLFGRGEGYVGNICCKYPGRDTEDIFPPMYLYMYIFKTSALLMLACSLVIGSLGYGGTVYHLEKVSKCLKNRSSLPTTHCVEKYR